MKLCVRSNLVDIKQFFNKRKKDAQAERISEGMSTPDNQLQHERQRRGLSQRDLARQLGVPASTITRWEQGKDVPGPYHQQRLHALFEHNPLARESTQASTTMTHEKREKRRNSQVNNDDTPLRPSSETKQDLPSLSDSGELPAWYPSFQKE